MDKIFLEENNNKGKVKKTTSLRTPDCCTLDNTCVQKNVYWGGETRQKKEESNEEKEEKEEEKRKRETRREEKGAQHDPII